MSASQELTYGLTSFVGSFTSLVFVKQMPNHVCQFLLQLQNSGLWPLDLKRSSLKKLVTALPTVHVPVLESDGYPRSPFAGQTSRNDYGSEEMHMSPPGYPPWVGDSTGRTNFKTSQVVKKSNPPSRLLSRSLNASVSTALVFAWTVSRGTNTAAYLIRYY